MRHRHGQPSRLPVAAPDPGASYPASVSILPEKITVHLDAGSDSRGTHDLLKELGCGTVISQKGLPLQAGARWVLERANSLHSRGLRELLICTERRARVIQALIALANAIIVIRRLVHVARTTHPWDTHPAHRP